MRLIDAEALKREPEFLYGLTVAITEIQDVIDKAPTVEERQHGHWIGKPLERSCCRAIFEKISGRWTYCPDCGAIMDGEPE